MVAGHLHRPVVTRWAGTTLAVCPSTAPQVALDFDAIDPERPDDRPMIVADPPWFAHPRLERRHAWSPISTPPSDHDILARYGPSLQPLVRMLAAEKS